MGLVLRSVPWGPGQASSTTVSSPHPMGGRGESLPYSARVSYTIHKKGKKYFPLVPEKKFQECIGQKHKFGGECLHTWASVKKVVGQTFHIIRKKRIGKQFVDAVNSVNKMGNILGQEISHATTAEEILNIQYLYGQLCLGIFSILFENRGRIARILGAKRWGQNRGGDYLKFFKTRETREKKEEMAKIKNIDEIGLIFILFFDDRICSLPNPPPVSGPLTTPSHSHPHQGFIAISFDNLAKPRPYLNLGVITIIALKHSLRLNHPDGAHRNSSQTPITPRG